MTTFQEAMMTGREKRKEREQQIRGYARHDYQNHVVAKECGGPDPFTWGHHWVVRNPTSTNYLGEVVLLYGPRVLVHGDCPDVLFARYSGGCEDILLWVANSEIDYLSRKVLTQKEEYDVDIAEQDLQDILDDWRKDKDMGGDDRMHELENLVENAHYLVCDQQELAHAVDTAGFDPEEFTHVGSVVCSDIIWAQEMVKKLLELIPPIHAP
jgi:hypothetical protein